MGDDGYYVCNNGKIQGEPHATAAAAGRAAQALVTSGETTCAWVERIEGGKIVEFK